MDALARRKRWIATLIAVIAFANALPIVIAGYRQLLLANDWVFKTQELDTLLYHGRIEQILSAFIAVEPYLLAIWAGFGRNVFGRRCATAVVATALLLVSQFAIINFYSTRIWGTPAEYLFALAEILVHFSSMYAICFFLVRAFRLQILWIDDQDAANSVTRSEPMRLLQIFQLTALVALACALRQLVLPYLPQQIQELLADPFILPRMLLRTIVLLVSLLPFVWHFLGRRVKHVWLLAGGALLEYAAIHCLPLLWAPPAPIDQTLRLLTNAGLRLAAFCLILWLVRQAGYRIVRGSGSDEGVPQPAAAPSPLAPS